MKADQTHIESIRDAFQTMQSKEDFLNLLNTAKKFVYEGEIHPFELKQITWYSNPAVNTQRYRQFSIKKKSGSDRIIHAPEDGLKSIQKVLAFVLECVFDPHKAAYGFVREKSIVDNASIHTASNYVYNTDLKDFFPSIEQARVWKCLQLKPFHLMDTPPANVDEKFSRLHTGVRRYKTEFGEIIYYKIQNRKLKFVNDKRGHFAKYKARLTKHIPSPDFSNVSSMEELLSLNKHFADNIYKILTDDAKRFIRTPENMLKLEGLVSSRTSLANIIASLCCTEMEVERINDAGEWAIVKRNVLPQGAPTSPIITNIVCQRLDYLLTAVAKRFGLKYSRYADDITFSSMHNVYQAGSDFINELHRIIKEQGFHIKESKTRLQKTGYRQEVTGLLVNEKANVQRRYIKQLRMWLYYWERYGYDKAYGFFVQQYLADKGHIIKGKPDMANVISGKIDYLKMVKGVENDSYMKLKARVNALTEKSVHIAEAIVRSSIPAEPLNNSEKHLFDRINKIEDGVHIEPDPFDLFDRFLKAKTQSKENEKKSHVSSVHQGEKITNQVRITLEVYKSPELNERLISSINIPKDTLLPSTIIVPNSIVSGKEIQNDKSLTKSQVIMQRLDRTNAPSTQQNTTKIIEPLLQTDFPGYIDPTQLSVFLMSYNQHPILKYSCHHVDDDALIAINNLCGTDIFNLEQFQQLLAKSFKELSKPFSIPKIGGLIFRYLNGGSEWSSDNIKVNWNLPELFHWSRENPGMVPNPGDGMLLQKDNTGFEFAPFKSKIFGTPIGSFSQLVIHFKNLFHIRADNPLKKLIENVNAGKNWNNQINFKNSDLRENIEFFTDVDKLLQAYQKIIAIILDVSRTYNLGKPEIVLALKEEGNSIKFSIHHKNSEYKKTVKNAIERLGKSQTELIVNQVNGLCDLYIQADFANNDFARINLWNGENRTSEQIGKFFGVEYQLIFKVK